MRTLSRITSILLVTLGLGLICLYGFFLSTAEMPVQHRVPTATYAQTRDSGWILVAHYCCSAKACREHHLEYRFSYVWSN